MKNKGFTLIELLGVMVLLALVITLAFPSLINSIKKSSNETDELTLDLIYNAADLYIENHSEKFETIEGNKYEIKIKDLIDEKLLVSTLKLSDSEDVASDKCIQVSYNDEFKYELKNNGECETGWKNYYQQVEYIESSGTQWIDTNYTPVMGDSFSIEKVKCEKKEYYQTIFSAGIGDYQLILLINSTSSLGAFFKYFSTDVTSNIQTNIDDFTKININNGELYYNDVSVGTSNSQGEVNTPLRLFKRANDEIKLDLVPCYRKSDGEIGMYDIIGDKFYTNAGTGTFIKGQDTNSQ